MKRVILLVAAVVLAAAGWVGVAPAVSANDGDHPRQVCDVQEVAEIDVDVVVDRLPCRPHPGDRCWLLGVEGIVNEHGRCICIPPTIPTTTTTTTTAPPPPPVTVPGPPGPAGPPGPPGPPVQVIERQVEVPVRVEVPVPVSVVVATPRPAPAVVSRPAFAG